MPVIGLFSGTIILLNQICYQIPSILHTFAYFLDLKLTDNFKNLLMSRKKCISLQV